MHLVFLFTRFIYFTRFICITDARFSHKINF